MLINRKTDYALRTLVFLTMKNDVSTINEVSEKLNIAHEHLTKIVSRLSKLKYITTLRGRNGGTKINSSSLDLTLGHIVARFENSFKVINCESPICPIRGVCRLEKILNDASDAFVAVLEQHTLSSLIPKSTEEMQIILEKLAIKDK